MRPLLLKILLTWLLFIPVPILNGLLREKWYKQIIGEAAAHRIGAIILAGLFLLFAYVALHGQIAALPTAQIWRIGIIWLTLTLTFEFGLGLLGGQSWSYMLADYKIWQGRLWPIVPAATLLSPLIIKWLTNN